MAKVVLSQAVFENLIRHLLETEEGKSKFIDQYFPEPSKERDDFEDLLDKYLNQINNLVKNASKTDTSDYGIPFVTIGSHVEVQDLTDQEVFSYRIVNPSQDDIGAGDVSCLSPVGKSLLLKKAGDEVEVKAPGGLFRYKVKSIQLLDIG